MIKKQMFLQIHHLQVLIILSLGLERMPHQVVFLVNHDTTKENNRLVLRNTTLDYINVEKRYQPIVLVKVKNFIKLTQKHQV